MSRILESVEKHYDNGIELEFNTLHQLLRTLQDKMNQNAAGVDVSGKWFFDRYSPVTNIKAVGQMLLLMVWLLKIIPLHAKN